jgi:hypothetical protein
MNSDYSSHSILVQQSGTGSPTSLQISNNTLVGRLSGGGSDINDLSVSQVKGLLDFTTPTDVQTIADAKVTDAIVNGVTTVAPSQNAVFDALTLKQDAITFSTGLTNTSGTLTNNLSTGVSGGQTLNGGTASGNSLTIQSTTNATKGSILLAPTNAGEVWQGTTTPNPLPTAGETANHLWGLVNEGTTKQMWSMWAFGSGAGFFQNNMHFYRSRGTIASPTAVQSGDFFKSEGFRGYDGVNMSGSQAAFQVIANENWTSSARGTRFQFEVTAKLSGSRIGAMSLDSEGLSIGNTTSSDTTLGMTIDVWGNNAMFGSQSGAKTRTNATDKTFRLLAAPYTNANGGSAIVLGVNNSSANILYFGGGSGNYNAATQLNFYTAANNNTKTGTVRFNTNSAGRTFFGGTTSGTALIHIAAGTATANTAPLKLTSGVNLTTPEDGAFEFDGTNLYFTVGGVRKTVTLI